MGKYRCPWCGEMTLTTFQKTSRRSHEFGINKVKNKFYFSCPSCNKEIGHKITSKGKKYESILKIFILAFLVLLFVFTALNLKILILADVVLLFISAVLLILVYNKFTEFIKHETDN